MTSAEFIVDAQTRFSLKLQKSKDVKNFCRENIMKPSKLVAADFARTTSIRSLTLLNNKKAAASSHFSHIDSATVAS